MQRDVIDFGRMRIPQLFVRLFIPTLLGLLFTAIVTLADSIFVGRGVGSDALAATRPSRKSRPASTSQTSPSSASSVGST